MKTCRINNAGTNAYKYRPLTDSTDEDLQEIVTTNVLGIMLCCREVRGREQLSKALNFRAMQRPISRLHNLKPDDGPELHKFPSVPDLMGMINQPKLPDPNQHGRTPGVLLLVRLSSSRRYA